MVQSSETESRKRFSHDNAELPAEVSWLAERESWWLLTSSRRWGLVMDVANALDVLNHLCKSVHYADKNETQYRNS